MNAFKHAALQAAADSMKYLQPASKKTAAHHDPVESLRPIDYDPAIPPRKAEHMHRAAAHGEEALAGITESSKQLDSWDGAAGTEFTSIVERIARCHAKAAHRAEDTAHDGDIISVQLDGFAYAAAADSARITQGADASAVLVLKSHSINSHVQVAVQNVNDACREIHSSVKHQCHNIADMRRRELTSLSE